MHVIEGVQYANAAAIRAAIVARGRHLIGERVGADAFDFTARIEAEGDAEREASVTADEDRIGEIERMLLAETQREVWYDDTRTHGWKASAVPTGSRLAVTVGPFVGTGATKLEAAESLLADLRKRVAEPQG